MCLSVPLHTTAHAQNARQALEAPAPQKDEMDDVSDEYIEEANAFYDECAGDYQMGQYFNCECLSVAYLDARIEKGKMESSSSIKLAISRQCRDAIGAAGPVYQGCLRKANRFEPGTDPEKYCECVANTYVKNINRDAPAVIDSRSMVSYQVAAYTSCNNPRDRR